jgi:hypothetical protein
MMSQSVAEDRRKQNDMNKSTSDVNERGVLTDDITIIEIEQIATTANDLNNSPPTMTIIKPNMSTPPKQKVCSFLRRVLILLIQLFHLCRAATIVGNIQFLRDHHARNLWITNARDEFGRSLLIYASMFDKASFLRLFVVFICARV